MQQMSTEQAVQVAIQHHLAGRLAEAEGIYRQVLAFQPNHAEAWYRLGTMAQQLGKGDAALQLLRKAAESAPREAMFHLKLAVALQGLRQLDEAVAEFSKAIAFDPTYADAHFGLGIALYEQRRIPESIDAHRNAIRLRPAFPEAHYNLGCIFQSLGRIDEALAAYSRALEINPRHAAAHNNMGNALKESGKRPEAIAAYRRAIEIQPDFMDAHCNLGATLREEKKYDQAVAFASQAVQLSPGSPEAQFNLACALYDQGKMDEAIARFSLAIGLRPNHFEACNGLGNAYNDQGKYAQAIAAFSRALELNPDFARAWSNMGNSLKELGRVDESIAAFRKAVELAPNLAITHYNMASALWAKKQYDEVVGAYKRAIELQPDFPDAWYNMGICFYEQGKLDEAAHAYAEAFRLRPTFGLAYLNFGNVRKDQGLLDEALACYDRAIALQPERADVHSNRIYVIHFHHAYDKKAIYEECREWNRRHAEPLRKFIRPHGNSRDPQRRLRIGYMSPDFTLHPIGRFMMPLLQCHDHSAFEVFCYADVRNPDVLTEMLQKHADVWRNIRGMSDEQAADLVRKDQIDILVDLAMHMTNNRLLVFARKPAPVQVTYLAYCSTTGVEAIDYRFTDPYLDPPGQNEQFYCERTYHLPQTYWCYDSGMPMLQVASLAAETNGHVTFGCLNNFCKASPATLATWCRILRQVPGSCFILHASKGSHRKRFIDLLEQEQIDPVRVSFVSHLPYDTYFRTYDQIDIGLDPFPWPGGTTTCDALWMGVPVVSLAGETAVSRAGLSLLSNIGLPELVAFSQDQYVHLACDLAKDIPRLAALRAALRERMLQSPLMDRQRFARDVEAAYREMWRRWCQSMKRPNEAVAVRHCRLDEPP
jgi:predicted O-linked N-acetylglucosamine transferase (SPINDLY family)